jgi:PiT family inorganic phosphate transporter
MNATAAAGQSTRPDLNAGLGDVGLFGFLAVMVAAMGYVGYSIYSDAAASGAEAITFVPFLLLFVALLIALGFEFVNGFHDTANAVATVIYTHSLPAHVAVVISGFFNFLGVLVSSGVVAYTIISLLPVELILQVGSSAGFAMVFALLIAAVIWNVGTWYLGLPSSSSHTLIGSVIGVGVANAMLHGRSGTSGVDWEQAWKVAQALIYSPLIGFGAALVLFVVLKTLIKVPALYKEPVGDTPPPWWIRLLLVMTCASVSFGHGSNDGQKGMGLIMLILIGIVPTAYALNKAVPVSYVAQYHAAYAGRCHDCRNRCGAQGSHPFHCRPQVCARHVAGNGLADAGCRRARAILWQSCQSACGGYPQRSQRHVSDFLGSQAAVQGQEGRLYRRPDQGAWHV